MKYKMYCIFAKESIAKMNGNRGKLAAQAGHAFLHAYWDAMNDCSRDGDRPKYNQARYYQMSDHTYKITLVVDTVEELQQLHDKYKDICGVSLVKDAGFTVFTEPTVTCLGLGPIGEDKIGEDLKGLKLLI